MQDRVNTTQTQIDQLTGQMKVLADQASYGTLTVTVTQQPPAVVAPKPHHRSGLALAWDRATNGFVTGVESLVARSGGALVVLLGLLSGLLVLRVGWRMGRRRLV